MITFIRSHPKLVLGLLLLASIALNAWLVSRPAPAPVEITKTEYVDRVVEKEVEKIVYRDIVKYKDRVVTRTITKPGGTKIVEVEKESSGERGVAQELERREVVDKTTKRTESVAVLPKVPRYLLRGSVTPDGGFGGAGVGVRLLDALPVFVGVGVSRHDTKYGLTLDVGVTF